MKISYNWLNEYLPQGNGFEKKDPEELSQILTGIGLEVEGLETQEQVKGNLEGLVIGEVVEAYAHPNADRLKITAVNIGTEEPLKIVCGAPNVAVGQKVVVAPAGTTIYPIDHEPVKMKKAKIRGEESWGMICAEDEIGLGTNHEGILVLDAKALPGTKAKDFFELKEDWIYEIGLTPNRMDAMSHLGVARDICAKWSHASNTQWTYQPASVEAFEVDNHAQPIRVSIENTQACLRYSGVTLTQVKIRTSPEWLQQRLLAVGMRPVNNVVDITNFVLHETGQPLHAFDLKAIKGNEIIVKNLPQDTPFITLDGETRKLSAEDLMICNAQDGMCMAGIFGGIDSGVKEDTTELFLESANFDSVVTRRSSFRHGLRTDAAMHFEKGVDISKNIYALKRAALLMKELCGAKISSEIIDVYPTPVGKQEITLQLSYLNKLSGKTFTLKESKAILINLGFEILRVNKEELKVAVPYFKPDMTVPADLVEEIMRIDGYDQIAIPSRIEMSPSSQEKSLVEGQNELLAEYLSANGFHEILTNSITNSKYYKNPLPLVHLLNSLTSELDVLRYSLVETGLEAVAYNINRQQENILLFELGKTYSTQGNREAHHLALYGAGNKTIKNWAGTQEKVDPFFLKGQLNNLLAVLGFNSNSLLLKSGSEEGFKDVIVLYAQKEKVGLIGQINQSKRQLFDIKQPVWTLLLNLDRLNDRLKPRKIVYKDIPKFPSIKRDLAVVLDKNILFDEVKAVIHPGEIPILQSLDLFDTFESKKLGVNKKSYGLSFTFRHNKKTLTDKEIDQVMTKIIEKLRLVLNAKIRS